MGLSTKLVTNALLAVILLIMVMTALSETASEVGDAADGIVGNGTDTYPLVNFFKKKGVVLLAFIAGIVILIVKSVMGTGK